MPAPRPDLKSGYKLTDRVHSYLRAAILSGEVPTGSRLVESDLAKELGISRSPVREAVRRLEQEGLVVVSNMRVMARQMAPNEIDDLFWVCSALEGLAALLAAPRLTSPEMESMERLCADMDLAAAQEQVAAVVQLGDKFHEAYLVASGNQRLIEMLRIVREHLGHFRSVSERRPDRVAESIHEHRELVRAFRDRDALRAESVARRHILGARAALLSPSDVAAPGDTREDSGISGPEATADAAAIAGARAVLARESDALV